MFKYNFLFLILLVIMCVFISSCTKSMDDDEKEENPIIDDMPKEAREVAISVNSGQTYQTMEGFGGFGAQKPWWSLAPYYNAAFVDLLINDLGITILRDHIPLGFEPENDNDDPYDLDLSKFNLTNESAGADSHLSEHFPYLKAMHVAGLKKLFVSVWSPPIWMKYNDHRGNGTNDQTSAPEFTTSPDATTNQLKEENYQEFAEYCVAYIKILKRETGIDLYAISLQNEPRFSQFYSSCVYSFESMRDVIKVVSARFREEGITTKIMAPEDVQSIWHIRQYLDAIIDDPEANKAVDIFAIHNYQNDGINPSDEGPMSWQETFQRANDNDKVVWMSETSGFDPSRIKGGIDLAKSMYNAIHFGQASAWVYWQMSEGNDNGLIFDGKPTYLYYVSQQFYKHVQIDYKRVQVNESEEKLLTLGFVGPNENKKTVILINTGEEELSIRLNGDFSSQNFDVHLTSSIRSHEKMTTVSGKILLPPMSVLTLSN